MLTFRKKYTTKETRELFRLLGHQEVGTDDTIAVSQFKSKDTTWYATEFLPKRNMFYGYMENHRHPDRSKVGVYFSLEELHMTDAVLIKTFESCPIEQYLCMETIRSMWAGTGKKIVHLRPEGMITETL